MSAFAIEPSARSVLSSAFVTRAVTAIALVAGVLGALFLLPTIGWGVAVLLVIVGGAYEWGRLIGLHGGGLGSFAGVTLVTGVTVLWLGTRHGWSGIVVAACGVATIFWLAIGIPSVLMRWRPSGRIASALAGWIVLIGAFTAVVALQARSPWLALAAMATVWIADTAAYLAGRRFGRRKLAPQISPGKTWEGAFGGVGAVVVYGIALIPFAARAGFAGSHDAVSVVLWMAFSAGLAALSIVGDLYESLLKRRAGVKDSGALLPGHGGVLDRTDALLAAMPPVALMATAFLARP